MLGFTIGRGRVVSAGIAVLGMVWLAAQPVRADEMDDLRRDIEQLKQQVTFLQNQIPGAGAMTNGTGGTGPLAAQQEVRMQQFQDQITQITGQIEQVGLKVDDLSQRLDKLQKDVEFRLSQLEQAGGSGGMNTVAPDGTIMAPQGGGAAAAPATEADAGQAQASAQAPAATTGAQPGVLGTLTPEQAANLPQAPEGAAEAAAAAAAGETAAVQGSGGAALPGDTPNEQYDYATGLLQRGAYAEAEVALKAFVAQHPKDPLAGNAQYWLGETYYVRSDFKNAAVAFAEGYQKYPNSSKAPDNLLKLGMSLGQTGQKDNACTAFRQLGKQFPAASGAIKDRAARAKQRYGCPA